MGEAHIKILFEQGIPAGQDSEGNGISAWFLDELKPETML